MPSFSKKSKDKLSTCHPKLQKVFNEVIKTIDCTIIEGIRTKETQEEYVRTGRSKTMNSYHLEQPDGFSHAVDVAPYPIDWSDKARFALFAGYVLRVAEEMNVDLTWGGDWDGDWKVKEHSFFDGPHFQLEK